MTLKAGTRFGSYEVTARLGAGGMGEVYRAMDTALKRDVAIKVLPESFAADADRLARFQREAEVLASLNHSNIAQIYGLEESDGQTVIVMELVEGPTLADRIAQGPVPADEALDIAAQIAEALEAAHDRGIVHRDLKPANIKLRADGVVKVLDFGIAKAVEPPLASSGADAPVLSTPAMTKTGVILGTAAYMSPEQARGKALDARTDIWAFGAVLYEMLAGQPPFLGEDVTETVAAVLKSDPDWSLLPELPPLVLTFLRQCLRKEPKDRIHHIADVRLALTGKYEAAQTLRAADRATARRRSGIGWALAGLVGLALGAAGVGYWNGGASPPRPPMTIRQLTFRHGLIGGARFASDGEVIVYGAAWDDGPYRLYTTRIDSYQSRPMDLAPADLLAVSKDNTLALSMSRPTADGFLPRGTLAEVSLTGGAPRELDDGVVAADWGPDGQLAAIVRRVDGQSQLEFPVGTVVYRADEIGVPRVSPDGSRVCFQSIFQDLMLAEKGYAARVLIPSVSAVNYCAWKPNGKEVWFTYSPAGSTHVNLDAVSLDGQRRRVLAAFPTFAVLEDVSRNGAALIAAGPLRYSAHGARSPAERELDLGVLDASRVTSLNGAGTDALIVDNRARGTGGTLFLRPTDGSPPIQFGNGMPLALSPDGAWIAALGEGTALIPRADRITLIPTGPGEARTIPLPIEVEFNYANRLGTNPWNIKHPEFSDDGRRLLLPLGRDASGTQRAYVHDFVQGWTKPVTPEGVTGPVVLSPDGRFVASNENDGMFVYAVDTGERREVPGGRDEGMLARWSSDEAFVYLVEPQGAVATIVRRSLQSGEREIVREVRARDPAGVTRFDLWIARDGEAYAYTLDRLLTNLFLLDNLD
jgi:hypothetical protein